MSLASDLLDQASTLAGLDRMKPKQASLRRAISAAYYSVFHLLIDDGARRITTNATLQPYVARSFQHTSVKDAANKVIDQLKASPPWPAPLPQHLLSWNSSASALLLWISNPLATQQITTQLYLLNAPK